mmetsp:Transcript_3742/g.8090  ORF Transcript_3742/g.8090 Transcript_3742/m.8090 type:complete len:494 (+) Transcript_3742:112-1593(+)
MAQTVINMNASTTQYNSRTVSKFEWCFGEGFMSAGGITMTKELIDMLQLSTCRAQGDKIKFLDIGCGIGGNAFYIAKELNASVLGLDISRESVSAADKSLMERYPDLVDSIKFMVGDATDMDFREGSFDVIFSRDVLLHVPYDAKLPLFKKFHKWLKPKGQLLISDYGTGEKEPSEDMKKYMAARHYALLSVTGYQTLTVDAGFGKVNSSDRTWQYCQITSAEMSKLNSDFDKEFSTAEREDMEKVFRDKIEMCMRSDRTYIALHAVKQSSHHEYRAKVLARCKEVYSKGMVLGTDGNVSHRIPGTDLMAIKGSGIPYEDLTVDDIVLCKLSGERLEGEKKPSSEVNLHSFVYKARTDINAVVHTHSMHAAAVACARLDIPCFHYSVGEIAVDTDIIRCAPYHCYGTPKLGKAVVDAIGNTFGCLMANHGQVCVGATLDDATYFALRMENICEMFLHTLKIPGGAVNLSKNDMCDCRDRDKTYGQIEEGAGAP